MYTKNISVKLTPEKLSIQDCYDFVSDPTCGGIVVFTGTVRNKNKYKTVKQLNFHSYNNMALKEMRLIAESALKKIDIHKIAIHHAEGVLKVGEIPVIVATSAIHREAAFEACKFAMDTLKKTVPIWKKEQFEDGETWVNANP